ncbi:MAG: glycosyltransferase family 4 protein [Thermoplasmata archaeon]
MAEGRKLRIAMLAAEYPPKWGGIGVHAFNLSAALARRGHEVHVITRLEKKRPPAQEGVHLHFVNWLKAPLHFILSYGRNAVKKMEDIMKSSGKFDIIHAHSPLIALEKEDFNRIRKSCTPLIATMHGTWMMERLSVASEDIRHLGINDLAIRYFSDYYEEYEKAFLKESHQIITISNHCLKELETYGADFSKVNLIPNGINTKEFYPEDTRHVILKYLGLDPEKEKNTVLLLYVGRYAARKGLAYLVKAMDIISKWKEGRWSTSLGQDGTHPHGERCDKIPDIRLIMIGKPGRYLTTLKSMISRMKDKSNIHLLTEVGFNTLRDMYRGCDIFVLPSTYEGQGIVIMEAMACKKPVIASDCGGIPDMVKHGENGLLVPVGDSKKLAASIVALARKPEARTRMGENNLKLCHEVYDWDIIAEKVEKVYYKAIENANLNS